MTMEPVVQQESVVMSPPQASGGELSLTSRRTHTTSTFLDGIDHLRS